MQFSEQAVELNEEMSAKARPVVVFIGLLSILGLVGNSFVILVFTRKYPKCNFKYFVLVLAGIDLGSCLVLMPMEIYTLIHWFVYQYSWLCKAKSFLNVFAVTSSAGTLLLIAIDRFRKVCRPHSQQIQPALAVKLSILVLTISAIPATSDAIFWGIHTHKHQKDGLNMTLKMCEKDDRFKDTIYPRLHVVVLFAGLNCFTMATTLVLYSIIAAKLFCMTSLPGLRTPAIKVTTSRWEDRGLSTAAASDTRRIAFQFSADEDTDTGSSDSEDNDASENLSNSQGNATNDENVEPFKNSGVADLSLEDNNKQLEMVPLRNKNIQGSSPKKTSREDISAESGNRNLLQIPVAQSRRPPRSPNVFPTLKEKTKQKDTMASLLYHRRRHMIASGFSVRTHTRLRRKTLIMFILSAVFVGTTVLFFCLSALMAKEGHFVTSLTAEVRAVLLFFLRFYFINSVINPVLYGFLDRRFCKAMWNMGLRVRCLAGAVKRNRGQSIQRSNITGASSDLSSVNHMPNPRPILKSR